MPEKIFKIRGHYGRRIISNRGAGQGDTWSLIDAILITTIQMHHLCAKYERLKVASVVDDRNFRGPTDVVMKAAIDAIQFDTLAGL